MLTTLAAQNWGLFVLRGILALAVGILAFVAPAPTLGALIFVFGVYAVVDGAFAVFYGALEPGGPRWLIVIGGILGIAIGAYTFVNPSITAVALVIVIGAFAIVRGAAEVGTVISLRDAIQNAWLYVLSGIVSIVFGAYLLFAPPADGVLTVLFVIGYYALFAGVMYVAMGLRLRGVNKTLQSHSTSAGAAS